MTNACDPMKPGIQNCIHFIRPGPGSSNPKAATGGDAFPEDSSKGKGQWGGGRRKTDD